MASPSSRRPGGLAAARAKRRSRVNRAGQGRTPPRRHPGPPRGTSAGQRLPGPDPFVGQTPRQWSGWPHCGLEPGVVYLLASENTRVFAAGPCGKTARRLRLFSLPGHHCVPGRSRSVRSEAATSVRALAGPGHDPGDPLAVVLPRPAPVVVPAGAEFSVRERNLIDCSSPGEGSTRSHVIRRDPEQPDGGIRFVLCSGRSK